MRGKQAVKREVKPEQKYGSELIARLINYVMVDGKKSVAETQVYNALDDFASKIKGDLVENLEKAISNVKPKMEIRSKRVGGSNFQVPVQVDKHRQQSLALRWITEAARKARGKGEFWQSLSRELVNSYKNEGTAVKKKEEIHRMADANKAFSQFA